MPPNVYKAKPAENSISSGQAAPVPATTFYVAPTVAPATV